MILQMSQNWQVVWVKSAQVVCAFGASEPESQCFMTIGEPGDGRAELVAGSLGQVRKRFKLDSKTEFSQFTHILISRVPAEMAALDTLSISIYLLTNWQDELRLEHSVVVDSRNKLGRTADSGFGPELISEVVHLPPQAQPPSFAITRSPTTQHCQSIGRVHCISDGVPQRTSAYSVNAVLPQITDVAIECLQRSEDKFSFRFKVSEPDHVEDLFRHTAIIRIPRAFQRTHIEGDIRPSNRVIESSDCALSGALLIDLVRERCGVSPSTTVPAGWAVDRPTLETVKAVTRARPGDIIVLEFRHPDIEIRDSFGSVFDPSRLLVEDGRTRLIFFCGLLGLSIVDAELAETEGTKRRHLERNQDLIDLVRTSLTRGSANTFLRSLPDRPPLKNVPLSDLSSVWRGPLAGCLDPKVNDAAPFAPYVGALEALWYARRDQPDVNPIDLQILNLAACASVSQTFVETLAAAPVWPAQYERIKLSNSGSDVESSSLDQLRFIDRILQAFWGKQFADFAAEPLAAQARLISMLSRERSMALRAVQAFGLPPTLMLELALDLGVSGGEQESNNEAMLQMLSELRTMSGQDPPQDFAPRVWVSRFITFAGRRRARRAVRPFGLLAGVGDNLPRDALGTARVLREAFSILHELEVWTKTIEPDEQSSADIVNLFDKDAKRARKALSLIEEVSSEFTELLNAFLDQLQLKNLVPQNDSECVQASPTVRQEIPNA